MGIEEDVEKLLRGESAEPDFISKSSEIGQEYAYITEEFRADELRKRKMETFGHNEFVFEYNNINKHKSDKD
jgi:hypothetical protein